MKERGALVGSLLAGLLESFNGKMRDECLNVHWFADVEEARSMIEDWGRDHTQVQPHSSLGNRTPSELAAALSIQVGLQRLAS